PGGRAAARRGRGVRDAPRILRRLRQLPRADAGDDPAQRPPDRGVAAARAAGEAPAGVQRAQALMQAYKFMREGRMGPFSLPRWEIGEWVEGGPDASAPCRQGAHACRPG